MVATLVCGECGKRRREERRPCRILGKLSLLKMAYFISPQPHLALYLQGLQCFGVFYSLFSFHKQRSENSFVHIFFRNFIGIA